MNRESSESICASDDRRRKLLACIDRVLSNFGPDVRRALIFNMRRKHNVKRYEIPDKPLEFSRALHEVFGRSASGIEQRIVEIVVDEFHLSKTKFNFQDAVRTALSNNESGKSSQA